MSEERIYINMCSLKEKVFDNGGSLINAAFNITELQKHADQNGWVNIVIAKRRAVSEKGATHYAYKNTFEPNRDAIQPNQPMNNNQANQAPPPTAESVPEIDDDDLPF